MQCLSKGAIAKILSAEHSGASSKGIGRGILLPATGLLVYVWRHRQPALIRRLPCDFVRETPGDVLSLPDKQFLDDSLVQS